MNYEVPMLFPEEAVFLYIKSLTYFIFFDIWYPMKMSLYSYNPNK
jgi:hypothetical protein